jgi:nucleotidyltransferase/DNA polymerase involved in DNA repair
MALYVETSRRIRRILREESPVVEPLSIDEAFVDATGIVAGLDGGGRMGQRLKEKIRAAERLTCSVGVAPNKFLAKLASDLEKPDGLVIFRKEEVPTRLWPMPSEKLWGVGPKIGTRLTAAGLRTVGDIARCSIGALGDVLGRRLAMHVRELAAGRDDRQVKASRDAKSISAERTYAKDLTGSDEIDHAMLARSEAVARELRREGLVGRTVHLKIRAGDFTTWTRSHTLVAPTDLTETIVAAARELYRTRIDLRGKGVRLVGVGLSGLENARAAQHALFPDPAESRSRRLAVAGDAVCDRMGTHALVRARLLRRPSNPEEDPPEATSLPAVD